MKKSSQSTKPNLKNVDQTLFQDLSKQQSSNCIGGAHLVQEFEAELATLVGSKTKAEGKIRGPLLL